MKITIASFELFPPRLRPQAALAVASSMLRGGKKPLFFIGHRTTDIRHLTSCPSPIFSQLHKTAATDRRYSA